MAARGRPSESLVRREQILEAAARCIVDKGLRGATLEAIAKEAATTRGNVRHFLGNREELIAALLERINARDAESHARLTSEAEPEARREALLDYLYGPEFSSSDAETQVLMHFTLAARSDAAVRESLNSGYAHSLDAIRDALGGGDDAEARASVLLALALGNAILGELDLSERVSDAVREQALRLIG